MEPTQAKELDRVWSQGWNSGVRSSKDAIGEIRQRYVASGVHTHHITQIVVGALSAIIIELEGIIECPPSTPSPPQQSSSSS